MTRRRCTGPGVLAALRAAVANLASHADEINALNVYPVPDGDTGLNMLATMRSALAEAELVADAGLERIAGAASFGALMGARGNSGVILSQVLRGMADALGTRRSMTGLELAHALSRGSETAYAAVVRPVEGTILTVIRETAASAEAVAERGGDVEAVLTAAVDAAEDSLARTPSLLPILREAGVVDAGGAGLYRILQGALLELVGGPPAARASIDHPLPARASVLVAHADEGYGYETVYLLRGRTRLDLDTIRTSLEAIGESVLVAGDARAVKVHVHNEQPDAVLAFGLSLGTLSQISVENLDRQAHDLRESRAAEVPDAEREPAAGGQTGESGPEPASLGVIAVTAGDGLAAIFADFGVSAVVRGGQGANPSTGELLASIDEISAREIILLPNNANVLLAARQVAGLASRPIHVVPTRNAAEGIAALMAVDPALDGAANVGPMTRAARSIQTLAVTEAVRDATIGDRKVKRGQVIVLDPDDGLVAVDHTCERAIQQGLDALAPGFELVTVYYGEDTDIHEAESLVDRVRAWHPDLEVELVRGGQPHYRFLIAAE